MRTGPVRLDEATLQWGSCFELDVRDYVRDLGLGELCWREDAISDRPARCELVYSLHNVDMFRPWSHVRIRVNWDRHFTHQSTLEYAAFNNRDGWEVLGIVDPRVASELSPALVVRLMLRRALILTRIRR